MNPTAVVDEIIALYNRVGDTSYDGEAITQMEHGLQCAKLAADAKGDDMTVVAALLHDIGHICAPDDTAKMGSSGVVDHEGIGAKYLLERGFRKEVASLVHGHVEAKRYLTFKNADYHAKLSEASKITLRHQGGPMSPDEAAAFESDPLFRDKLRLRSWDEQGKQLGLTIPPIESYREMMLRVVG
ncbi:MAG: HD domain-containing protein [Candidatus Poribacteria bacterium]|nr:HD domain-containing protein [Candidatus Poribacteria bacterium]